MSIPPVGYGVLTPESDACTSNPTVQGVQQALNQLAGQSLLAEDGSFDSRTSDMLRTFQEFHGLPATGTIDQATVDALNREVASQRPAAGPAGASGAAPTASGAAMRGDHALQGALLRASLAPPPAPPPTSPLGSAYGDRPPVGDNEPIFTGGAIDRYDVVSRLTQYDQSSQTTSDADRCGATAAVASAIMANGQQGLLDLAASARRNVPAEAVAGLGEIEQRIRGGTATFGDLGRLADILQQGYALPDPNAGGRPGILAGDMLSLYRDAGMRPPSGTGDPHTVFQPGQSWPIGLQLADGSQHWVVTGRDPQGRVYIYDPLPTPGHSQLHYEGTPGFQSYLQQIQQTGSGFAPITEEAAERSRQQYEQQGG